jgi:hypothetical protein
MCVFSCNQYQESRAWRTYTRTKGRALNSESEEEDKESEEEFRHDDGAAFKLPALAKGESSGSSNEEF